MTPPTREEREELERWMESDCNSQSWREKMTPIITALEKRLEAAEADTARLDWLNVNGFRFQQEFMSAEIKEGKP